MWFVFCGLCFVVCVVWFVLCGLCCVVCVVWLVFCGLCCVVSVVRCDVITFPTEMQQQRTKHYVLFVEMERRKRKKKEKKKKKKRKAENEKEKVRMQHYEVYFERITQQQLYKIQQNNNYIKFNTITII